MNSPSAQSGKYWLDGRLIRELRDRQGYSQQTFATKADLSKRTLIGIEQQARPAYDTTLDSIYRAFLSIGVTNLERSDLLLNRPEAPLSRANAVASPTPVLGRRLPDFVGRQRQLTQVLEQLTADDGPVNISALRGMGGIGKTTLAVQAGLALAGEYPDGQLLLDLAGLDERPPTPGELMKRVIQVMCPERLKLSEARDRAYFGGSNAKDQS